METKKKLSNILMDFKFERITLAEALKRILLLFDVMRSAFSAGEAYQLWHNNKLEEEQPDFDEWMKKHFA